MKELLITSSVLIIVLLILRAVFAKSVRRTLIYSTWLLVALRLLIPVQFGEMSISVLNLFQPVTQAVTDISNKPVIEAAPVAPPQALPEAQPDQPVQPVLPEIPEQSPITPDIQLPDNDPVPEPDMPQQEVPAPEVQPPVQEQVQTPEEKNPITVGQIAWSVWAVGSVLVAIWLSFSNLHFVRRMKKTATAISADSPIPVYVTENAVSPCLVGLFRPAVYLTPEVAKDEQLRRYVMTHELTHYAHKDHIWSTVRCLCLCLYWFDPLVWVAAWCSRRDCELACDEGAMARLGEEERIAYGKALLTVVQEASVPSRLMLTATTMAETKRQLRRRVNFIARKPHLSLFAAIALVLVCSLVVGCVATGAMPQTVAEDPIIESPAITEPTEATTPTEAVSPTETVVPTETTAPVDSTTAPATEPTKQTQLGSTPTKAPITVVTSGATTAPAAKPTEKPTSSQATVAPTTQPTSATTLPTAKPTTPVTTVPTQPTQPSTVPTAPQSSAKVLEIYGLGTAQSYIDYSYFNADSTYLWMMRAAAEEWAALNGYELRFKGAYEQSFLYAEISAGSATPDILIHSNQFPKIANAGLSAPLTAAEYQKLASICGKGYLDLLNYKNASHGFVLPWSSSAVCYYNDTRFKGLGLKSPKKYFMEGNWNWDTFMHCLEQTTLDLDMDGDTDAYGMPGDSWAFLVNPWATDANGALVSTIDEPFMQDYFQLKYDAFSVKKVTKDSRNTLLMQGNPIFSMQLSMCKTYDLFELYQYLSNGNMIEVVPVPAYGSNYIRQFEQNCASLASTCDQREGAVDLLAYMLKCGMKYMSEYSMGMIPCSYEGLQGTCQRSADFLNAHNKILNDRYNKYIQQDWNQIFESKQVTKLYQTLNSAKWYIDLKCTEVTPLTKFEEIAVSKPSFAVPNVKHDYQLMLNKYNALYIY